MRSWKSFREKRCRRSDADAGEAAAGKMAVMAGKMAAGEMADVR